jgi:DNA-binding CsgD family transcriptional regulator
VDIPNFLFSLQTYVGHALLDTLRQPTVLCNTEGSVLHCNQAALTLMESTSLVWLEHQKLKFHESSQMEFHASCAELEQQLRGSERKNPGEFRLLQLTSHATGSPGEKIYAFYTVLEPQSSMTSGGMQPLILLFLYHPESASALDVTLLKQALKLSPMECRIASMLAEGLSVKKIAGIVGTQQDTVRKQLQSIYKKTSTKRQSELIKLLLNLPSYTIDQHVLG